MKKNKTMLIISIFLVFLVTIGITTYLNLKDNSNKNVNMNQNVYEDIVDEKENIINIEFQPFYGHEPNLEFLTNEANLIVSGTIDTSSLESVVENINNKSDVLDTITLFGFTAEEMLEAGAEYEDVMALGGLVE